MNRPRTALSITATLAVMAAFAPVTASAEGPPELAAVTTVSGSGPASTLVSVTSPARISEWVVDNKDISVEGDGRYVGVALVAEGSEEQDGPLLLAGRIHPRAICDDTGCPYGVATPVIGAGLERDADSQTLTVPAGLYRLHLISERSAGAVSVTLRFGGLSGALAIEPAEESGTRTLPLPPRVPIPASQSLYWNGGVHDIGSSTRGLMWSMAWLRQPIEPEGHFGYCVYRGRAPEDAPGCPTADINLGITFGIAGYPVKAWVLMEGFGYPVQGSFGQKLWYAADLADGVDGLAVWLPFGDVPSSLPGTGGTLRLTIFPVLAIGGEEHARQPLTEVRCDPAPCADGIRLARV